MNKGALRLFISANDTEEIKAIKRDFAQKIDFLEGEKPGRNSEEAFPGEHGERIRLIAEAQTKLQAACNAYLDAIRPWEPQ